MRYCYIDDDIIIIQTPDIPCNYEIACSRANTPEKVLGWIMHLSDKRWMDTRLIKCFISTVESELNVKVQWPS